MLKWLKSQKTLESIHARWSIFLEKFKHVFNHKLGPQNMATNALSRHDLLVTTLSTELVGFNCFKDQYITYEDFQKLWHKCLIHDDTGDFHINYGFLFKRLQLCVPRCSLRTYILYKKCMGEV